MIPGLARLFRPWSLAALLAALAGPALADPPRLDVPVRCELGQQCVIQAYVDDDPSPAARDYTCGGLSTGSLDGTAFRATSLAAMTSGIWVTAAAAGKVKAVRDGMPDRSVDQPGAAAVKGREAGNAVVIDHGDGWETQYSHLKRGSLQVAIGDVVSPGQRLGLLGLSGNTDYPHLMFSVRHDGKVIDPFLGPKPPLGCGVTGTPLWTPAAMARLPYVATGLLAMGFAPTPPKKSAASRGAYDVDDLPQAAPGLYVWVELYGAQKGDQLRLRLSDPAGSRLQDAGAAIPGPMAELFAAIGLPRPAGGWKPGTYHGQVLLLRAGMPVFGTARDIRIAP